MKIVSWNVNGLRSVDKKQGFRRWMERCGADIIGVQEVRARTEQLPRRLTSPKGWFVDVVAAERKGYSGVALYSRREPERIVHSIGSDQFDSEGRVQIAEFDKLVVANVYFPNGNGKDRDNSRVPYKLGFYRALYEALDIYRRQGRNVVVMGDFNTAHRDIDLARPRQNAKTSGFLPEERKELDRWIANGYGDSFRQFCDEPGHYTWWSQRFGVREKNIGWRIDYVLTCEKTSPRVRDAFILKNVRGSDHCPLGVELAL